ncbi:MAG: DUF1330 domain-containing protein [Candidatus Latescibacterota bacterium]|jgi:quinol monooxygenase YgiN
MATLIVRHKVEDFGEWKKAYDAFDNERKTMGVTGHGVYQLEDNPNDVTVLHKFANMEAAKSFAKSDRLKEIMKGAGVVGKPDMWFTIEK